MKKNIGRPRSIVVGETYKYWTVLEFVESTPKECMYLCFCKCGTHRIKSGSQLKSKISHLSCGCFIKEKNEDRFASYIGKKFHFWTVKDFKSQKIKNGDMRVFVTCICDCGTERDVVLADILNGKSKSCSCHQKEVLKKRVTTHGFSHKLTYERWAGMIQRCRNPNHISFKNYGARGIKVCQEWLDYPTFLKDMGLPPGPDYSLDRINNDGNYEKCNCRWATPKEQANNRSHNKHRP